jgi:hypothetical protein
VRALTGAGVQAQYFLGGNSGFARTTDLGTDATGPATRLISTAEPLASVLARLELAREPRLLSIITTPLADVARVKDMLRAIPGSAPRIVDTDDRRELHMTVEVRDGEDNWLGDVQFVWCA